MKRLKLICLTKGKKKDGSGNWYKATILGRNTEDKPVTSDFFLPKEVGEKMEADNLMEDADIKVDLAFDDYLRPTIVGITRATTVPVPNKVS